MATQREVPYTGTRKCVCGKVPRTYITDYVKFHNECYPCQIITPRMSTQYEADRVFSMMVGAVITDRFESGELVTSPGTPSRFLEVV